MFATNQNYPKSALRLMLPILKDRGLVVFRLRLHVQVASPLSPLFSPCPPGLPFMPPWGLLLFWGAGPGALPWWPAGAGAGALSTAGIMTGAGSAGLPEHAKKTSHLLSSNTAAALLSQSELANESPFPASLGIESLH